MGVIMKNKINYTGAGGGGNGGVIYSEEEREVGVWTDGKPLYQKTYIFDINDLHSGSVTSSDIHGEFWIDNLNHDKIWLKEGFVDNTAIDVGDTGIVSHPSNYPSSGTYLRSNIQVNSSVNNGYPFIYFQSTYNTSALYDYRNELLFIFTICYTKATDTPGSGIWTTTGEYAHHYSTDEKVVGTWTDGKPLYEKCIQTSISTHTTLASDLKFGTVNISSEVSNVDMLFVDTSMSYFIDENNHKRGFLGAYAEPEKPGIAFTTYYSRTNLNAVFTIQYTKTS